MITGTGKERIWCVLTDMTKPDFPRTLCGYTLYLPWGISDTEPPTCPECLEKLREKVDLHSPAQ